MEVRDLENFNIILLLKSLGTTDVVELSEALKQPLENTLELVKRLIQQEIISRDEFGHIYYISKRELSFKVTNETLPALNDQIMNFLKVFTPINFPRQKNLVQNQLDGMIIEWGIVKDIMENESEFILIWDPKAPVKDIEISYNHGEKIINIQVKSTKSTKLKIEPKDYDRLYDQYGENGYFALKINDFPTYYVPCKDLKEQKISDVDENILLTKLSKHYNTEVFKKGIKHCIIP